MSLLIFSLCIINSFFIIFDFLELEAIDFLHACEFDLEKTKVCMDMYYTIRTMCTELFGNRDVFGGH